VAPAAGQPGGQAGRRYFTNVQLVDTKTVDNKDFHRTFVEFKLSMVVNYAI
jgi:hypothetical protein